MLIFTLLGLFVWSQGVSAWTFARFLFFPLPAWMKVAEYAPASPQHLAALGLTLHLALFAFGLVTTGYWARVARQQWRSLPSFRIAARRIALAGSAVVAAVGCAWYLVTTPRVVHVVPALSATNVPRDTVVVIQFSAPNGFDQFLAGGFSSGLQTRYADTGEYIPGTTMGSPGGLTFDPDGLLRPNARVEIVARWANKRPYVLRFTTAGADIPSATPIPHPADWLQPVPTALPITGPPATLPPP